MYDLFPLTSNTVPLIATRIGLAGSLPSQVASSATEKGSYFGASSWTGTFGAKFFGSGTWPSSEAAGTAPEGVDVMIFEGGFFWEGFFKERGALGREERCRVRFCEYWRRSEWIG